jgi:hypothetical protein
MIIAEHDRDTNVQNLWASAANMLDFLKDATPVLEEIQMRTVSVMMKQIYDCAMFVREYGCKGFLRQWSQMREIVRTAHLKFARTDCSRRVEEFQ